MTVENYSYAHDVTKSVKQIFTSAGPALVAVLAFLSTCEGFEAIHIGGGLTAAFAVNFAYRWVKNHYFE